MTALLAALLAGAAVLLLGQGGWPSRRTRRLLAPTSPAPGARFSGQGWVLLVAAAAAGGMALGPTAAVAATVAALAGRQALRVRARRTLVAACATALPAVCRALAAELAAGVPAPDALAAVAGGSAPAPVRSLLATAAGAGHLGLDAADVLAAGPPGCERLRLLSACWRVCTAAGGGLGVAVSRLAGALQDDREAEAAIAAELAGPRLSARVMALLPLLGLALGAGFGSDPLRFLLRTPAGLACLLLGVLLDAVGMWWVWRLSHRVAR